MSAEPSSVTIGWAYGPAEAAMAMSLLDAAGIVATLQSRQMMAACWHFGQALGGVALSVPASQAEEALTLLRDPAPALRRPRWAWRRALLAVLVFLWAGVPPPPSGLFLRAPAALANVGQSGREGGG